MLVVRLLLLFSALLGVLTGIDATRATARPPEAHAVAAAVVIGASTPVAIVRRVDQGYSSRPPLRIKWFLPVTAMTARVLFAERRRQ